MKEAASEDTAGQTSFFSLAGNRRPPKWPSNPIHLSVHGDYSSPALLGTPEVSVAISIDPIYLGIKPGLWPPTELDVKQL